jgi:hypothetical protein
MKIIIYWNNNETKKLLNTTREIIDNLWLTEFIEIEKKFEDNFKTELSIKKEPALIIEEESIEFKDVIFEWINPPKEEIEAMITSIIWSWSVDNCAPSSCSSCWSASVCGV